MPTEQEFDARIALDLSKQIMKETLVALDPSPAEPVALAMLAAIDALDAASRALAERTRT